MKSWLLLVFVGCLAVQESGLVSLVARDDCADECSGDGANRSCPPLCPDCACCAREAQAMPDPHVAVPLRLAVVAHTPALVVRLDSADPRPILHVPRALLG